MYTDMTPCEPKLIGIKILCSFNRDILNPLIKCKWSEKGSQLLIQPLRNQNS